MEVHIRKAQIKDAKVLNTMMRQVDVESPFMLWQKNERPTTTRSLQNSIRTLNKKEGGVMFLAEINGKPVGFLCARRGVPRRMRHVAYMYMGVLDAYIGKGVGYQLMDAFVAWGKEQELVRLEFEVRADNERALKLYKEFQFKKEGTKKKAIFDEKNEIYKDLLVMGRVL